MNFTDLLFMPAALFFILIYYLTPQKARWVTVLCVSILFYCSWGIELFPWVLAASVISYLAARAIDGKLRDAQEQGKRDPAGREILRKAKKQSKYILAAAIVLIVGFLIYIKTQSFMLDAPAFGGILLLFTNVQNAFEGFFSQIPVLRWFVKGLTPTNGALIFMPLGISYYTMALTGYMLDVYWRKEKAQTNYLKFLTFVLYFPKIIQGPITKPREIWTQLCEGSRFDYTRLCFGLQRVLWGYFKKLVIADRLSGLVTTAFSGQEYSGAVLLTAAFLGAIQLYCDFSGYMDIALGISEAIGITMPENFRQPFFAKSAAEFWRRWHITLSRWFKDYIYMPLVISPHLIKLSASVKKRFGKRAGKAVVTSIPIIVIWTLTGLWHGTGWNYLVWGVYWATLMTASALFEPEIARVSKLLRLNTDSEWFQVFRQARTFLIFLVTRFITLPQDLQAMKDAFAGVLFDFRPWELFDGTLLTLGVSGVEFVLLAFAVMLMIWVSAKHEGDISIRERVAAYPLVLRWGIYLGGILFVAIFGAYGSGYDAASFAYMNF